MPINPTMMTMTDTADNARSTTETMFQSWLSATPGENQLRVIALVLQHGWRALVRHSAIPHVSLRLRRG